MAGESEVSVAAKKGSCTEGPPSRVSASSSSRKSTPTVEGDHQLALALSEDYPQVDEELARRLYDLDSTPVSTSEPKCKP